ncbi:DNA replication and repair protein RecF [subsurface metagenome]
MKILKLEIKNIRGIPDFKIEPKGKSFVIYGPNGSGKSAVIDALDFLLTGKIARLSGEGTEDVSLREYGPHIDKVSDLSKVEVKAEIQVPGIVDIVSIHRKMQSPNELVYDAKHEAQLSQILELLNRGQYVFTRREVLKLITSKSSTRAQEIQKVLKLVELENTRANLVRVFNESKREYNAAKEALERAKQSVLSITGETSYIDTEVLNFINEQRAKLGGVKIDTLSSKEIQTGITGVKVNPSSVSHKLLSERVSNIKSSEVDKVSSNLDKADSTLKSIIIKIKEDELASWNAKRYTFTKDGIKLIRETGECPLCDNEWLEGELKNYLQERVEAESTRQTELTENSKTIVDYANSFKIKLQQLQELVRPLTLSETVKSNEIFTKGIQSINDWSNVLSNLSIALADPLENYENEKFPSSKVKKLFVPDSLDAALKEFEEEIKKLFPEATPEQTAWDNLTKLVERIKIIEESQLTYENTLMILNRATALVKAYVEARDEVLESLYNKIKDRFVGLYKEMHGADEEEFSASFTPQDSGLKLKVDFYGRGLHPPNAMHSEGHQDSMGVCLFLALSEHLNTGLIDLVILDDVVMSVDVGHRRAFCSVLAKNFPDKQFIMTTHDTTWANQIRSEGLVNSKQMLKFYDWSVDDGRRIHYEADVWNRIEEDLKKNDISAASAKLRNGLEEFTRFVCHNLRAKVPYTLDDVGSMGDFLQAAIGTYNDLLSKAKVAANSWNRKDEVERLKQIDDKAKAIIKRALGEQWTINTTVHYNAWANLGKVDFTPVVYAFKELCDSVFSCDNEGCESVLKVTLDGATISGVRCKCGNVNWNLIKK